MIGNPAYPTYQVFLAVGIAALVTALVMPLFIRLMRHEGVGQQVRADGPQGHLVKQGTPTMGGIVILLGVVVTCALLGEWTHGLVLAMAATLITGSLGLLDDIESVAISPLVRFPGGFALDLGVLTTTLEVGGATVSVPWLYLVFVFLLMAGLSNAVNLTDGLDGLAGGCTMVVMLFMAMVAFRYDELDLAIFAASIAGACVGFLWHNCYPASIFMGDTGSLALGAAFAALAVLTETEVTSLIMGGLFIAEALSVMIQVFSFKLTGRRVFLMAPIHHHFEKKGWKENKVVVRFWIVSAAGWKENKVVVRFWIVSAAFAALGFALYFQLG